MKVNVTVGKCIDFFLFPIKDNLIFFCLLYVLGITTILIQTICLDYKIPKFDFLSYIIDIYIICIVSLIFPQKQRSVFLMVVSSLLFVLSVIDAFCVFYFSAKIGPEILNVVIETDKRESSEFISRYIINPQILLSPVFILFCLMIGFIMCIRNRNKIEGLLIDFFGKYSVIKSVLKTLSIIVLVICFSICSHSRANLVRLTFANTISEANDQVDNYTLNTPFNNLLFAIKMRNLADDELGTLAENQNSFSVDECLFTSKNIVLIIGESYIKGHSQLYGYCHKTTPNQEEYKKTGRLIAFTDVVSPSNLTSVVFRNFFSLHSIDDPSDWSMYPLFPLLFRKAGYNVMFLSNQFVKSIKQDVFNFSGGLFLNENRLSKSLFDRRNLTTHRYDEGLLEDYDSLKQFGTNNNFIIFHLAGQHIDFNKRCPDEKSIFSSSDYVYRQDLSEVERQLVADYDNATLYNDYVLKRIIDEFDDKDVIMIYMPDHGEECYDELHRIGRLPSGSYSAEMARQEYRIPFWIYCTEKYRTNHPDIFEMICNSANKPFMTDDLPHMLLSLAGIETQYYISEKDLLNDGYNTKRKRLIDGKIDYDDLVKKDIK